MNPDAWLVQLGLWHFGPFAGCEEAEAFAEANGGMAFPLWAPDEQDALDGRPALEIAREEAA